MADKTRLLVVVLIVLSLVAGLSIPVSAQTTTGQHTMLQNLAGRGDFSTLANAAKVAGLDGLLSGSTQYTLFAPNNAAFNKIPQGSISALLNDKAKLGGLLRHHVVPGKITYADLAGRTSITAADGRALPVAKNADGSISVGGVRVLGQGIDSSNGVIYPVESVLVPQGFAFPQAPAATAQAPAQGIPWGWLGLLGLLVLGGLALYLLTRPRRHAEPRYRYEERERAAAPRYEERVREEVRRPEETMRHVRESTAAYRSPQVADIAKNLSLPLSGVALAGLNSLIGKGTFTDKQDFVGYLANTFLSNNLESKMAGGREPSESLIMDIIDKTGIAKGFTRDDTMKMLVPLLITGFMAVYHYMQRKPAVKTT